MDTASIKFLCEVIHFKKSIQVNLQNSFGMLPKQQKKFKMALDRIDRAIHRYCDEMNVEVQELEGIEYEEGLPVDPLNIEDFKPDDTLYIDIMIEPVIKEKGSSRVLRNGKAFLAAK